MTELKILTVEELALDAFQKEEHLKALSMAGQPIDFGERQKAYIEYQKARANAAEARRALEAAIG